MITAPTLALIQLQQTPVTEIENCLSEGYININGGAFYLEATLESFTDFVVENGTYGSDYYELDDPVSDGYDTVYQRVDVLSESLNYEYWLTLYVNANFELWKPNI